MYNKKKCYQCRKHKKPSEFVFRIGDFGKGNIQSKCKQCVIENRANSYVDWGIVLTLKENAKSIVDGDIENISPEHIGLFLEQQSMVKDMDEYVNKKLKK